MNKIILRTFLYMLIIPIIFSFSVLTLLGSPVYADHDPMNNLQGPAFSDPSKRVEMPAEWEKQPIKYERSTGDADIVIALDQHTYPAFLSIIQKYAKDNGLTIHVKEGTCGVSAGMLSNKTADIGGYCCPPGAIDRLPGLRFHTLGISSLAFIVHPENPFQDISFENVRQVFAGDISNWSDLKMPGDNKGPDMPINPVARLHCKLRPGAWRSLLNNQDLFSMTIKEVGVIPDMISEVASNKMAIGYEELGSITNYKDRGAVRALKIDGASPYNQEHLISGRYPIYRTHYLTTWDGANVENPKAQKLVAYLLDQVNKLDKKHYIVPASILKKAGWKFQGNELVGETKQ